MSPASKRVVICGGGVAGVEALLALHAHVQVGVAVDLIAPEPDFVYRPLAVGAPFGMGDAERFDLAEIAAHHSARLHLDRLTCVEPERRRVALASGLQLAYDFLLVAVGARPSAWLKGALHFGGAGEVSAYRVLLERLERGEDQSVCFVAPARVAWTLPLYELALLTASHLAERGVIGTELVLLTHEEEPLAMFGSSAARTLRGVLSDRGIVLRAGQSAHEFERGQLLLCGGDSIQTDAVVTLPELSGPAIPGLPSDAEGFVRVDSQSRVEELEDVYAAGDGTDYPIKQGGIAAQQADVAVTALVAALGLPVAPTALRPTLRGMLLTGITPIYLRSRLANGAAQGQQASIDPLWWPASKIAARYLTPYLATRNADARERELSDRPASQMRAARATASHEEARALAVVFAERDAADEDYESALGWIEVLERLDGALAPELAAKREQWHERLGRS